VKHCEASQATYDHVLKASRDKTADNLKAYLADPIHANNYKRFVEHNPDTTFSSNPRRRIKTELPQLYSEIKTAKKGSGLIKFLPDNKKDLVTELFRLMRCSVTVETVSDVSECFQVIVARLGDLVGMFLERERLVYSDAKEFDRVR